MSWLLDTNACIRYLNGRAPKLKERIDAMSADPNTTLANQKRFLSRFQSLVFDDRCSEVYGEIRAELTRKGKPIGPNDLLIASTARANSATLVTHNVTEFSRIGGLHVEDWEAD